MCKGIFESSNHHNNKDAFTSALNLTSKFKQYLSEIGYRKGTQAMISRCTETFLVYYPKESIHHITSNHIITFHQYLQTKPCRTKPGILSEKTVYDHIYSLKVFFKWLEITHQIIETPTGALSFKQPKINTRKPLTQYQIQTLFNATETEMERAILHLFYSCGLRLHEAVMLNTGDFYPQLNTIIVRAGKNKKRRVIPITEKVKIALLAYQNFNIKYEDKRTDLAFILNKNGTRMLGNGYSRIINKITVNCTLNTCQLSITPHVLRHSIATHLLENGCSMEFVRDFLGHKLLDTTQIYTKVSGSKILVSR